MEDSYEVCFTVRVSAQSEYTALMAGCLEMMNKLRTEKPENLQTSIKLLPRWAGNERLLGDMT